MFFKKKKGQFEDIELVQREHHYPILKNDVETIYYDIVKRSTQQKIGKIDLRLGMNAYLYYLGQVGYFIYEEYRGHYYSYKACKALFEIAKNQYLLDELWITCSPDNEASYKVLMKLNGQLIETVDVPEDHELYWRNERIKCIFKYDLRG